ncbi:MAG: hypothetical protein Tsb0014_19470 [Pleurocapsa sp.]
MRNLKNNRLLATIKVGIAALVLFPRVDKVSALEFVSNFSEASGNTGARLYSIWQGSSFTTDSLSYTLNSATLSLRESQVGDLFISLYDDNSGRPGSIVSELTTSADIDDFPFDSYEFVPTFSVELTPNTTYWLIGGTTDSSEYTWETANSGNEISLGSWSIGNYTRGSTDEAFSWTLLGSKPTVFSINATVISAAVPFEFSPSLGLLALHSCGMI